MKQNWLKNSVVALYFFSAQVFLQARTLNVLTYDSMLGQGSFGEWLGQEFAKECDGCRVHFVSGKDHAGLAGRIRRDSERKVAVLNSSATIDVVLGLESHRYRELLQDAKVAGGKAFDRSPFAMIVDRRQWPQKDWPKTWKDVAQAKTSFLIVQDPRLSETGIGWLRAIFEMKALSLEEAKKVTARVFPSWSSSYSAFLKGQGRAVWTFLTSEAYHRCENAKKNIAESEYLAIPLAEGYPVHEEWAALVVGAPSAHPQAQRFLDFVISKRAQEEIPLRNWMLPVNSEAKIPDCYQKLSSVKSWIPTDAFDPKKLKDWAERWSL